MCEYCNGERRMVGNEGRISITITGSKLWVYVRTEGLADDEEESFHINLCPMCGRKLEGEKE